VDMIAVATPECPFVSDSDGYRSRGLRKRS
jgi:hypothetical protein